MKDKIIIKGAKENNLKNIDIELPRDKMIVVTGVSGSGKSSLAFDTIYAEGQRRYVESLSAYARQFLGQMEKPNVEYIEGLSPAISIDQKQKNRNPRSTVGTVTEIYDYLRLLYARVGDVHCYNCGEKITKQSIPQMVDRVMELEEDMKIYIMAPLVKGRKGSHEKMFETLKKDGYVRVRIDGVVESLEDMEAGFKLDKNKKHNVEVIIDRLKVKEGIERRLADSFETALKLGERQAIVLLIKEDREEEMMFSEDFVCLNCNISYKEVEPRIFSFNSPFGSCPSCLGLGYKREYQEDLIVPNMNLSIREGALNTGGWNIQAGGFYAAILEAVGTKHNFSLDTPYKKLSKDVRNILMHGSKEELLINYVKEDGSSYKFHREFEGVIPNLERRYKETSSEQIRHELDKLTEYSPCEECKGRRLRKEALSVLVDGRNIWEVSELSIENAIEFFQTLKLNKNQELIAKEILKEIIARLTFLNNVGLNYLSLSRSAATLSGGESQRIRLATQIGSGLVGVLYILDEPSIGLHQRDNSKLIESLLNLRDTGNTLIIVEHDEETMLKCDVLVDIGPGAGDLGGEVIAIGTPKEVMENKDSLTGRYLSGDLKIEIPKKRRASTGKKIKIIKAEANNLKKVSVDLELGQINCITGVSGSGKSTLINEVLYKGLMKRVYGSNLKVGKCKDITGVEEIDKVINIDQSPIGRTPRSNPATYTGVFDAIRTLFSETKESKMRGYKPGRFSFNVKGGRCENCSGDGIIKIEMHFLPDVYIPCEVCDGKRYNRETLDVKFKGKNISEVLDMTVEEAVVYFENNPKIKKKLDTLMDVGLSYIKLGQPATTLSGGEAQRIKLATELSKRSTGKTLYILDEPTTGLHFHDINKLLKVIHRLVDSGNTMVIIEHNLDVIKCADRIIDIGPEGGNKGGTVVATGTPEEVAKIKESYTGQYLKEILSAK